LGTKFVNYKKKLKFKKNFIKKTKSYGQIGDGSTSHKYIPTAVNNNGILFGKKIIQIAASMHSTCIIANDSNSYCWGSNRLLLFIYIKKILKNSYGQLGDGTLSNRASPVAVDISGALLGKKLASIAGGFLHTCAISNDSDAYCWGWNG
jgi:alpha-tubulin suppressor-like RCC1 family protein